MQLGAKNFSFTYHDSTAAYRFLASASPTIAADAVAMVTDLQGKATLAMIHVNPNCRSFRNQEQYPRAIALQCTCPSWSICSRVRSLK